jgi:hypothetical protein
VHFNRPRLKISANSKRNKKKKIVKKEDIIPVLKSHKKRDKKVKIHKSLSKGDRRECGRYKNVSLWKNLFHGHTAFILGNAPGIEHQNLSLLNDYFTIGINRIFYIYDPIILMWQDRQVWTGDKKAILKQKAIKLCDPKAAPKNYFSNFIVKNGKYQFGEDPSILHGRGNTTALAAQFSVALGCSNIVLLGTDCTYGHKGKTDFYGKNKDHKPYTLKMCNRSMLWLKENSPVPIYNCSGNKLWNEQTLEEVIKNINPQKFDREYCRKVLLR